MVVEEPRKLPAYKVEVNPEYWYCLHCNQFRKDATTMRHHVASGHSIEWAMKGEDFDSGEKIQLMGYNRTVWEIEQSPIFAKRIASLRGADDFVFEVGKGYDGA
ncbi:MAG: hypothetical protein H0U53_11140 [Actinobacteria bacterium]|nr:hypothetical protein [Actinomycetota bacterium]